MGQQQLLLITLVTIIVGIAIVIAVNTMEKARNEANRSAVRQDIMMVLNDAQIYYQKSEMMGGGGSSFDNISHDNILSIDPNNENGTYSLSGAGNSITVTGIGNFDNDTLSATATMNSNGMNITWSNTGD